MGLINKKRLSSEKGFALVTAILACAILFALAMLILQLSTGDLQVSSKNVGDKKAMTAAETGNHRVMQNFNPLNLAASAATNIQVDPNNDPASVYTISTPTLPTSGPAFLPLTGYAIGGGQSWGQRRYAVNVMGRNTTYNTQVTVNTGIGFGPIETSTMSR
jgi:Tfp pilus assembly protein PilX